MEDVLGGHSMTERRSEDFHQGIVLRNCPVRDGGLGRGAAPLGWGGDVRLRAVRAVDVLGGSAGTGG